MSYETSINTYPQNIASYLFNFDPNNANKLVHYKYYEIVKKIYDNYSSFDSKISEAITILDSDEKTMSDLKKKAEEIFSQENPFSKKLDIDFYKDKLKLDFGLRLNVLYKKRWLYECLNFIKNTKNENSKEKLSPFDIKDLILQGNKFAMDSYMYFDKNRTKSKHKSKSKTEALENNNQIVDNMNQIILALMKVLYECLKTITDIKTLIEKNIKEIYEKDFSEEKNEFDPENFKHDLINKINTMITDESGKNP